MSNKDLWSMMQLWYINISGNGVSPSYLSDKISTRATIHNRQTRYRNSVNIPSHFVEALLTNAAFVDRGLKIWNNPRKELRETQILHEHIKFPSTDIDALTNRQTFEGLTDLPKWRRLVKEQIWNTNYAWRQMIITVYRYFYLVIVVHSFLVNLFWY